MVCIFLAVHSVDTALDRHKVTNKTECTAFRAAIMRILVSHIVHIDRDRSICLHHGIYRGIKDGVVRDIEHAYN